MPSLRERFDLSIGNPTLGPEIADHLELRVVETRAKRLRLELAPFYRHSSGTIRNIASSTRLENSGVLDIYGGEVMTRVQIDPLVAVGGAYQYVRARSQTSDEPLDFLPHHRAESSVFLTPAKGLLGVLRARYISDAIDRGTTVPGYALFEASFNAQLTPEYVVLVRVDDLLDKRPETRSGYHGLGRVVAVILQATWE